MLSKFYFNKLLPISILLRFPRQSIPDCDSNFLFPGRVIVHRSYHAVIGEVLGVFVLSHYSVVKIFRATVDRHNAVNNLQRSNWEIRKSIGTESYCPKGTLSLQWFLFCGWVFSTFFFVIVAPLGPKMVCGWVFFRPFVFFRFEEKQNAFQKHL